MNIYRGYQIAKHKNSFRIIAYDPATNVFFKTEEEAMDKIDSIERERVARDKANIERVDAQIKR